MPTLSDPIADFARLTQRSPLSRVVLKFIWITAPMMPTPVRQRIDGLVQHYLSNQILRDRLEDLPIQWQTLRPRPWSRIQWRDITQQTKLIT